MFIQERYEIWLEVSHKDKDGFSTYANACDIEGGTRSYTDLIKAREVFAIMEQKTGKSLVKVTTEEIANE